MANSVWDTIEAELIEKRKACESTDGLFSVRMGIMEPRYTERIAAIDAALAHVRQEREARGGPRFSHRNGETDPPEEAGQYWVRDPDTMYFFDVVRITWNKAVDPRQRLWWVGDEYQAESPFTTRARFWGPIPEPLDAPSQPAPAGQQALHLTPAQVAVLIEAVGDYIYVYEESVHLAERVETVRGVLGVLQGGVGEALPAPDWADAPEWAMWWAVGADQRGFWFEKEPTVVFDYWLTEDSLSERCGFPVLPLGVDWRLTKQRRPRGLTDANPD